MSKFVFELCKESNLKQVGLEDSEKAQGLLVLEKHNARNSKLYFISPEFYKLRYNPPKEAIDELSKSINCILQSYPSFALRTCFVLDRFKSSEGLPSWRNLTTIYQAKQHILDAYKTGNEISEQIKVKNPKFGLILMSFENPKKGGLAAVKNEICTIKSCFGDTVLCARNQEKDIDIFVVDKTLEMIDKKINHKKVMIQFDGPREIEIPLQKSLQSSSVLSDNEIKSIASKCFEISEEVGDSLFEFLVTQDDKINFYGLHPYKY